MKKAIFIIIGIILVVSVIVTGSYGLAKEDIAIYEQAVALQEEADDIGFADFTLTDYPISFFDGDHDYVVTWENGDYHIDKRSPVLDTIVATAYPVEDHYEILVPTVAKMSALLNAMGTVNTVGSLSSEDAISSDSDYGTEEQIATIWHEALHAYQLTHFLHNVEAICDAGVDENMITDYADANAEAVALFEQQAKLLEQAVKCDDIDKIREYILTYKELYEERNALLPADVLALEEYYTRIEGSACYMEAMIYKLQLPDTFAEAYLDNISVYSNGSGKYYRIGMAQCMLLDKLDPEWKEGYDFSVSLNELLYRIAEDGLHVSSAE